MNKKLIDAMRDEYIASLEALGNMPPDVLASHSREAWEIVGLYSIFEEQLFAPLSGDLEAYYRRLLGELMLRGSSMTADDNEIARRLGNNIRAILARRDQTAYQLGAEMEAAGILTMSHLNRVIAGARWPRPSTLAAIGRALGVSSDELMAGLWDSE